MSINKIEEEDKSRRVILEQAAKMLATLEPQELTVHELQSIKTIANTAKKAIAAIECPSGNCELKASLDLTPDSQKVQDAAAATSIISKKRRSFFELTGSKLSKPSPKSLDPEKAIKTVNKAIKIVEDQQAKIATEDLDLEDLYEAVQTPSGLIMQEALETAAPKRQFINLAKELLTFGLNTEEAKTNLLEKYEAEAQEHMAKCRSLLSFRTKVLDALPENATVHDVEKAIENAFTGAEKEEVHKCLQEIFPNESYDITKITKEQLAGAKVRIQDLMSEHKTAMTNLLTTKTSVVINNLQTLLQFLQTIFRLDDRLKDKIIEKSVNR